MNENYLINIKFCLSELTICVGPNKKHNKKTHLMTYSKH